MQDLDFYLEQALIYDEGIIDKVRELGYSIKEYSSSILLGTLLVGVLGGSIVFSLKYADKKLERFNNGEVVTVSYDPTPGNIGLSHRGKLGIDIGGGVQLDMDGQIGINMLDDSKQIKLKLVIDKKAKKISFEQKKDIVIVKSPNKLTHSDVSEIRSKLR